MDLSGTWRAAIADDDLRRTAFALDFDDERLGAHRGARPLALHAGLRDSDGPLIYRTRFELEPASTAPATGSCWTGSSTRATSGSTAPTSAIRRATSSPTPTR